MAGFNPRVQLKREHVGFYLFDQGFSATRR